MTQLTDISRQPASQILLAGAPSLQILRPTVGTGLVPPNGAGRSTLFRLITGEEIAARGEMRLSNGDDDYYLEKAAALAP